MLETIREYAAERFWDSREAEALSTSHADHYLALVHRAEPELERATQVAWMRRLDAERENVRAALDWCERAGRSEDALRAALALRRFWEVRAAIDEVQHRIEGLLAFDQPLELRADALRDLYAVAAARHDLDRARGLAEERLSLYRRLGNEPRVHHTVQALAFIAAAEGDLDEARALITPVLAWARGVSDFELAYPLLAFGNIAWQGGTYDEAFELFDECLAVCERLGDIALIANSCVWVGTTRLCQGRRVEALPFLKRGLQLSRELGIGGLVFALEGFAFSAAVAGDGLTAARLIGCGDSMIAELSIPPDFLPGPRERAVEAGTALIGPDGFAAAHAEGEAMELDDAVELALRSID
jgi:tetratricopeptide (TPR) repeat protein